MSGTTLPAVAGPAIQNFTPVPIASAPADTYGFSCFFPSGPETVQGLGAYNGGNAGLTGPAQVRLWDANGNLLASTHRAGRSRRHNDLRLQL